MNLKSVESSLYNMWIQKTTHVVLEKAHPEFKRWLFLLAWRKVFCGSQDTNNNIYWLNHSMVFSVSSIPLLGNEPFRHKSDSSSERASLFYVAFLG